MNLKKCRQEDSSSAFINYYNNNIKKFTTSKTNKDNAFFLIDQDLINILWDGRILPLNNKWNQQYVFNYNSGIIHYIGDRKPWLFISKNKINKVYISFWKNVPELKYYIYWYALKSYWYQYKEVLSYINRKQRTSNKKLMQHIKK